MTGKLPASEQAMGVRLNIDDKDALKSLQNIQREVKNTEREFKNTTSSLKQHGDYVQANAKEINGLNSTLKILNKYHETLDTMLKNSSKSTTQQKIVFDKYEQKLRQTANQISRVTTQLDKAKVAQSRYDTGIVEAKQKHADLEQSIRSELNILKSKGKVDEANAKLQELNTQKSKDLRKELELEEKAYSNVEKNGKKNSSQYYIQIQRVNRLKNSIAQLDQTMTRSNTGITEVKRKHENLQKTLKSQIDVLKAEGESSKANAKEKELLELKSKHLTDELNREEKALSSLSSQGFKNGVMYQQQEQRVNNLRAAQSQLNDQYNRSKFGLEGLDQKNQSLFNSSNHYVSVLKNENKTYSAQATEIKNLSSHRVRLTDQFKKESAYLETLKGKNGEVTNSYRLQAEKLSALGSQISDVSNKEKKLRQNVNIYNPNQIKSGDKYSQRQGKNHLTENLLDGLGTTLALPTAGIVGMLSHGVSESFKLEQSITRTRNLLKTSNTESDSEIDKNIKKLEVKTKDLSNAYGISQKSLYGTSQELVKRGYTSSEMLGALSPLVKAAKSSNDNIDDVLKVSTSVLESFGKRVDDPKKMEQNTKDISNTIAYSSDLSSSDYKDTGTSLSYSGATGYTSGQSVEDMAAATGTLANNGIAAEKSGTGMRKIIDSIVSSSKAGGKALKEYGITIKDTHGKMLPISDIMTQFHDKLQGLSKIDKLDVMHTIFGTTGQAAATTLMNNSSALSDFTKKVKEAKGQNYIDKLSKMNMDNPQNQLERLKKNFENLEISMGKAFRPATTGSMKLFNNLLEDFNKSSNTTKYVATGLATVIPLITGGSFILSQFFKTYDNYTRLKNSLNSRLSGENKADIRDINFKNEKLYQEIERINGISNAWQKASREQSIYNSGGNTGSTFSESKSSETPKQSSSSNVSRSVAEAESTVGKTNKTSVLSTVEKDATKTKSLSKLGKLGKFAGEGAVGLDVAASLYQALNGTNKNNVGNHVGGATGSLGGSLAGGAIGSAVIPIPVLGTVLGAGVGGYVGDKLGSKAGTGIQHSIEGSNKPTKNNLSDDQKDDINNVQGTFDKINSRYLQEQGKLDSLKDTTSSSSEEDTKNYNNTKNSLDKKNAKDNSKDYNNLETSFENFGKSHSNKVPEDISKLLDSGYINEKTAIQMDSKRGSSIDKRVEDAKKAIEEVKKAEENGGKGRQAAVEKANKAIDNLYQTHYKDRNKSDSNYADKQKIIHGELANSTKQMSKSALQSMLKDSRKNMDKQISNANDTRDKSVKAANDKYNNTMDILNRERYVTGTITQDQYDDAKQKAEDDRDTATDAANTKKDNVVNAATDEHKGIVNEAQQQQKDYLGIINYETGQTLDLWDQVLVKLGIYNNSKKQDKKSPSYKAFTKPKDEIDSAKASVDKAKQNATDVGNNLDKNIDKALGYANGGDITQDQYALVNEVGQESAYNPKTNQFRLLGNGAAISRLHAGEHILNAEQTKRLIHGGLGKGQTLKGYKNGTKTNSDSTKDSIHISNVHSLDHFKENSKKNWKSISTDTVKRVKGIYNSSNKHISKTKKNVLDNFSKIESGVNKSSQNTIKGFNDNFSQLPTLARNSIKGAVQQLNFGINGINGSLNQFGSNSNVLNPVHYATGSNGRVAQDHLAMVNDAKDSLNQEAIVNDQGIFLPKYKDALINLNKGDQVLNGKQTKSLTDSIGLKRYANGSGVSDDNLKKIIVENAKKSNQALNNDFYKNLHTGSNKLSNGLINFEGKGLKEPMQNWYESIWNVLNKQLTGSTTRDKFLQYAKENFSGKGYSLGASGKDLYDCSSMVAAALKHFGLNIGRTTTAMQSSQGLQRLGSSMKGVQSGDLALFGHGNGAAGHVGIVDSANEGTMFNETPPYARTTKISDVNSIGLDGFYRILGLSDKENDNDSNTDKLAKKQLGKKRLDWVKNHLGDKSSVSGGNYSGDHAGLLKAANIPSGEWSDFNYIVTNESGWNPHATNPQTGAYGLPQSYPASKMSVEGSGWQDDRVKQLKWMRKYVNSTYGGVHNAKKFWEKHHAYKNGGLVDHHQLAELGEGNNPEMVIPLTKKTRAINLANQALDYVNKGSNGRNSIDSQKIAKLETAMEQMNKNNERMEKVLVSLIDKLSQPINAVVSEKSIINKIQNYNKQRQQSANMRGGTTFG